MQHSTIKKANEEDIEFLTSILEPHVPWVANHFTSVQLTLATLLWSFLLIISGYLARKNSLWFIVSILAIILHAITDLLDGRVSEYNQDGMYKWNFFMDHLLDFVLAIAVFCGLALYFYGNHPRMLVCIFVFYVLIAVNMVASFLMVAEDNCLDLGINIDEKISFNIFYIHIILIAFYLYTIITNGNMFDTTVFAYLSILLFILTFYNIYKKQQSLTEKK